MNQKNHINTFYLSALDDKHFLNEIKKVMDVSLYTATNSDSDKIELATIYFGFLIGAGRLEEMNS